jgi:glycosyltransferase involved in cell wall biosynthesis
MPRLIFVTGSMAYGGAERLSITVMNRLAERGHECHAVYVKNERPGLLDRVQLSRGGTLRCLNAARYLDLRALAEFAAHLAAIRPSVIVAANAYALMYAWLARRLARLRTPVMVTYHSTRLLGLKEQLQMLAYRLFFWSTDCAVFVCERQKRHWLRRGLWSRRSEVIYNGVDIDEFSAARDPAAREAVRGALGIDNGDYVIGMAAMLRPEKNPVQLVDAVAGLRRRGIAAWALLIGEGEMRGAVEARARSLGIERHVLMAGLQRDVRPYVAACDVMVLCSFTEALSLAAIEAMALGKPVVHSDVGGAREMIVPAGNGFLFPPGDTAAFVERLALLAEPVFRARVGSRARETAEELFSERTMINRYERTLLELCAQSDRPLGP